MYSKNLYLITTNYSKNIFNLRQWNLAAQYPLSKILKRKYPQVLVPGGKIVLSVDMYIKCSFSDIITVFRQL